MKRLLIFLTGLFFAVNTMLAQGVAINKDGSPPHQSSILDVKSTDGGMLAPRMTKAQRDSIPNPAVGLFIYQITPPKGFYCHNGTEWIPVAGSGVHYPGEFYGGGIVCHVNHTGDHGLICSLVDVAIDKEWSNVTDIGIGESAQSTWNSPGNVMAIMNQQNHVTSAAQECDDYFNIDYGTGTFGDWVLPSIAELRKLFNNL